MDNHKDLICQAFSRRLEQACDVARLPGYRNGRQSTIAEVAGVTAEAARRWFAGESMPRVQTLTKLAAYLKVDPSWLSAGDGAPAVDPADRRKAGAAQGLTLVVAGLMKMGGAAVAFSEDDSFTAIRRGRQFIVQVVSAKGSVFEVSPDYEKYFLVAAYAENGHMLFCELDHDLVRAAAAPRNGRFRVPFELREDRIVIGGHVLAPLDFNRIGG